MKILISACLLGLPCRYDGASKPQLWVEELAQRHELIPMCPEQMGGLPTPRNPSERRGDRVVMRTGEDVTEQYRRLVSQPLVFIGYNEELSKIILEEGEAYFTGQRTVEEAAERIQNRVTLYLSEIK